MTRATNNRRGLSWYVSTGKYSCAAIIVLLLVICASCAALAILAAPTLKSFIQSVQPQPTPTITTSTPGNNVALRKPVNVSAEIPGFRASMAVDGLLGSWWGSGAFAPQWIEIDLQGHYVISEVRLLPSQYPAGTTNHLLLIKGTYSRDRYLLMQEFQGFTEDGQWIIIQMPEPIRGVRFIQIKTTNSPSWISWREIQVITGE